MQIHHAKLYSEGTHQISSFSPSPTTVAPHKHVPIKYGQHAQDAFIDTYKPLTPQDIKYIQDIISTHFHYVCDVYPTLAAALSAITSHQAKGTQVLKQIHHKLVHYIVTNAQAIIHFLDSDMILTIHTDVSHLFEPNVNRYTTAHFDCTRNNNPNLN